MSAAATGKLLQSCPTLCNPIDGSPPGPSVHGILQARTLEWVAISFSNACMHAKLLQLCLTLRPYGQQPTRLLCLRDSLGKNTGVVCRFLLPVYTCHRSSLHPALCPHVRSLCLHLYCPENRFISTIFLDSIYVLIHDSLPNFCQTLLLSSPPKQLSEPLTFICAVWFPCFWIPQPLLAWLSPFPSFTHLLPSFQGLFCCHLFYGSLCTTECMLMFFFMSF